MKATSAITKVQRNRAIMEECGRLFYKQYRWHRIHCICTYGVDWVQVLEKTPVIFRRFLTLEQRQAFNEMTPAMAKMAFMKGWESEHTKATGGSPIAS